MAPTSDLTRPSVVAFDRLDSLVDPAALSKFLGPIASVRREPLAGSSSGFSNSRHEILHVERRDGVSLKLDNVAEAASILRPQVVDVSSGVERAPGVKDHDAVRAFVAAVRGLADRSPGESGG